ncbi:DUF3047 domain-containing protein [Marinobacter sp. SS21]|uniref:DUF3047 domain-containing protein n=1 Tax=Marinobacter sp. SS21 TaxID=2979460 RepID=UPI002330D127|nr:DUF3047 domain-containing protein [Marinobacter sp. SS21]MDC0660930.1 DUF3047 domain-containing protein [Marinobacter sp. SS21]
MKLRLHYCAAIALTTGLTGAIPAIAQDLAQPRPFSAMASLDDGWEPLEFPNIDRHSDYRLAQEDGQQVVVARADASASGLIARLTVDPGQRLTLSWRWKISNTYRRGDARRKDGDDYPARIYVAFQFEEDKAGLFERLKRGAVKTLFGEELPGNALNYIWANQIPPGTFIANPYTEQTVMVAVNSGDAEAGQWVTVERDLVADYHQAFGEAPPAIVGIGIMSDADNTGEAATAWYGDVQLRRDDHRE